MEIKFDGRVLHHGDIDPSACHTASRIVNARLLTIKDPNVLVACSMRGVPGWSDASYALQRRRIIDLRDTLKGLADGDTKLEVRVHQMSIPGEAVTIAAFLRDRAEFIGPEGNVVVYTNWIPNWNRGSRHYDAAELERLANHLELMEG